MTTRARQSNIPLMIKPSRAEYAVDGYRAQSVKPKLRLTNFVLFAVGFGLLVLFFVMNGIRTDPAVAEWWTVNIEKSLEKFAGIMTSWLPISVFELCVAVLIVLGVYLFVRLVINLCFARFKRIVAGLGAIAVGAAFVLDMYMMSMGFGYYRGAMPLAAAGADYTAEQAAAVAEYFLQDYNALADKFERDDKGQVVCPYTLRELGELLRREYARVYDGYMFEYTPMIKPITFGKVLSAFDIIGITFLPTGEANVNIDAPPTQVTATVAHELAHTKGIQREGDANLAAQYVLLSSDNDYLRYCGYYNCFGELLASVLIAGDEVEYERLWQELNPKISAERYAAFEYWRNQPDIIGEVGEFFNNIYLMFNGADNGTGSYDDGRDWDIITPVDPDTGEPIVDDDGNLVKIPVYSDVQKMYFAIYENKLGIRNSECGID